MRGIWSQTITLAVILQVALVSGKALIPQNQQAEQQLEKQAQNGVAEKRVGYDYPIPPPNHDHHAIHEEHHVEEHHEEHHDPGYWKKKLIWKKGIKKIWKKGKKLIWKPSWVEIWVPGSKMIWRPVWISEWFPSPDHHEHVHESHGWDRSDNNVAADSRKLPATEANPQQEASQQQRNSPWQFSK